MINDRLSTKNDTKGSLLRKQYQLKLENHSSIHEYKDFLKALETKKQERIQENDPNLLQ